MNKRNKLVGAIFGIPIGIIILVYYIALVGEADRTQEKIHDLEDKIEEKEAQLKQEKMEHAQLRNDFEVLKGKLFSDSQDLRETQEKEQEEPKEVTTLIGTDFHVTWYNLTGTTASGTNTTDGRTVAVDPSLIPYGTKLKITMPDGTIYYRVAEDTGSAVKSKNEGRVIDIYSPASTKELLQRGRTKGVKVEKVE